MGEKSPAFQFYPNDFIADMNVQLMCNQSVGCYIKLLSYCWKEGSIPDDSDAIAKLCRERSNRMAKLWLEIRPCFTPDPENPGFMRHPRLDRERAKQAESHERRVEAGRKGGAARSVRVSNAKKMLSSSTSTSSSTSVNTYTADFNEAWKRYPSRPGQSKRAAYVRWEARIKEGYTAAEMIAGTEAYAAYVEREITEPRFIKLAATFYGPGLHFQTTYEAEKPRPQGPHYGG